MIIGKITYIKEATINDVCLLCKWWENPSIMSFVGFSKGIKTDKDALSKKLLIQKETLFDKREVTRYIIYSSFNNQPIGECCINNIDRLSKNSEFGIKICELDYQNKGYGSDALINLLDYMFKKIDLNMIHLTTLKENCRAQAFYKKIGFREVGYLRKLWKDEDGIFHDVVMMDMLKEEYYAIYPFMKDIER